MLYTGAYMSVYFRNFFNTEFESCEISVCPKTATEWQTRLPPLVGTYTGLWPNVHDSRAKPEFVSLYLGLFRGRDEPAIAVRTRGVTQRDADSEVD